MDKTDKRELIVGILLIAILIFALLAVVTGIVIAARGDIADAYVSLRTLSMRDYAVIDDCIYHSRDLTHPTVWVERFLGCMTHGGYVVLRDRDG